MKLNSSYSLSALSFGELTTDGIYGARGDISPFVFFLNQLATASEKIPLLTK
jgi:hypothetical protein